MSDKKLLQLMWEQFESVRREYVALRQDYETIRLSRLKSCETVKILRNALAELQKRGFCAGG
jgi:hypothetical protein